MVFYAHRAKKGRFCLRPVQRVPGWCEGIWADADGRPGAVFLKDSRGDRVCPLQHFECPKGNSGGTAEMYFFALRGYLSGRFFIKGVFIYGKRTAEGVRTSASRK